LSPAPPAADILRSVFHGNPADRTGSHMKQSQQGGHVPEGTTVGHPTIVRRQERPPLLPSIMINPFQRNLGKSEHRYRAVVGDTVIAESSDTVGLEGNRYFPSQSVNWQLLEPSTETSVCAWKGTASYYDVVVEGERLPGAAWIYKDPSARADEIRDHIGFWRGVRVVRD
jgi:uncharacterized protein (DUF427 family)